VKVVGRYELLDPIGHGGMAVVYLARQIDLDRRVALKELRLQSPDEPALAERFLREAYMVGSMSHPNIVTVHEYFKHERTPYIAMEYMQRGSLRPWVGSMTFSQTAGVLEGLLAALDHAERLNIVHRDIKPENLLVTAQGQVKVADYGIAKARVFSTNPLLTVAGTTVGTPTYMAPEQAMAKELGPYTDLYAVGILAYELTVGRVPFEDTDTPLAIVLRHINEPIPSAHSVNPAIDRGLSDWIARLLVKDPAARTQTAEQAWEELEEVVLRLLGSRWRREARLISAAELPAAWPLTPATFISTGVEAATRESAPPPPPMPPPTSAWASVAVQATPAPPDVGQAPYAGGASAGHGDADPDPDPPRPPARPTPPEPVRRRGALLGAAAVVAVVLLAVVAGVALLDRGGGGGDPPAKTAGAHALRTADLELTLPASWKKRAVPDLPGLHPGDAVAATPGRGSYVAAELVGGNADPSLLAPKLLTAVERPPKPERTTLAGTAAYRYDNLAPHGLRERLRVYALLTNAGVATVACATGPGAAATAAAACDAIARTLKLTSAKALPIEPTAGYAATLKKAFASLDAHVRAANRRLGSARSLTSQAAALGQIGDAYAAATASLRRARDVEASNPVDARLNAALQTAFGQTATAYRQYERALPPGGAARSRAAQAALRMRAKAHAAVGSIRKAGYSAAARVIPRVKIPSLPATPARVSPPSPSPTPPPAPERTQPPPAVAPQPSPPPPPSGDAPETGGG